MRSSILVGVVLLGMGLMVGSGASQGVKKGKGGQLPPGWNKLELTPEQDVKVRGIMADYKTKIKGLEDQITALKTQQKGEMVKILNDTQKEKLKSIVLGEGGATKDKKATPKDNK